MGIEKETRADESVEAIPSAVLGARNPSRDADLVGPVLPRWRLLFISVSLCVGLFLSLLDTTIVATALYTIGLDLHSLQTVTWVALAYTLAYLSFSIIIARLADIIGRRDAWIFSLTIFLGFSLGCGFSKSLNALIICRVLQGIGGSGLYSLAFVILPEISPPSFIGYFGGIAGAVIASAGLAGPVVGGVVTTHATWPWIFWINAPIGIIALIVFLVGWPKPHMIAPVQKRPIREFDFVGSILVIAASVLVVFPFEEAGIKPHIWNTATFIAPLLMGCLCWCLLFGWEVLVDRFWEASFASMFPLRLLKHRVYMSYAIFTLLVGFSYFVVIYSLPLRFQVVNGKSPLMAGISLLPMLGAAAIGSTIGGALNSKKNNTFPILLVGSCLMALGTGLISTLSITSEPEPKTYGFEVLIGMAFGLSVSTVSIGANLESELRDTTVAQGIIAQMRVLGGSIGIAASTAILGITQGRELTGMVTEEQLGNLRHPEPPFTIQQLYAVRKSYADAFNEDMRVCTIIAGISILVAFGSFRRNPQPVMERKEEQMIVEQRRLRGLKGAAVAAKDTGTAAHSV